VKSIRESLTDFVGGQALADDITLVAIGIE